MTTKIGLGHFECKSTTDVGNDELHLEVKIDGNHREPFPYFWEFEEGAILDLERSYAFDDEIQFRLLENDPVFDNVLGMNILKTGEPMGTEMTFEQGGEYVLEYTASSLSGRDLADHAIDDFESSEMSVVPDGSNQGMGAIWPEIEKSKLVTQLRDTVGSSGNPNNLDQGTTPFCGFIAVAYGLAIHQPRRLVEITRALFETGEMLTVDDHIGLSDDFKTDTKKSGTDELYWLLSGSFREAANYVLDVKNDSFLDGDAALIHAAMPWTIEALLETTLDFANAEWVMDDQILSFADPWDLLDWSPIQPSEMESVPTVTTDEVLNKAGDAHRNDGVGVLLIEKELIDGETVTAPTSPPPITSPANDPEGYPNHYVTCLTEDPVAGTDYDFEVQSWGGRGHVDMPKSDCEEYIWGVVRAYP